jgi:hypothetical protein
MPKLDHPFHGKRASGRFGDMLVYGSWKGISYVRIYRKPKMKESARLRRLNGLGVCPELVSGQAEREAGEAAFVFRSTRSRIAAL